MGRRDSEGREATGRLVNKSKQFEVGDLVKIEDHFGYLDALGLVTEVKGKMQGANHDWNKYYYMVLPIGERFPVPVWNKKLELVRKVKR